MCFTQFSTRMATWLLLTFFKCLHNQLSSIHSIIRIKSTDVSNNCSTVFQLRALRLKIHHFHTKLLCHKPMFRQIGWWVQNGPIKKHEVLQESTLFFWKFCLGSITSYNEFIWCTNNPDAHICTFSKR